MKALRGKRSRCLKRSLMANSDRFFRIGPKGSMLRKSS